MKKITLVFAILIVVGLTSSQAQNNWIQKADFGGTARELAVGFSIGSKGYLGTGNNNGTNYKDFWEYDPVLNTWTQKADFGGPARRNAAGFSIGNKGYLGTGCVGDDEDIFYKDFWEYDPVLNAWTQKADFGGPARSGAVAFTIGGKGYLGTGFQSGYYKDFWEYSPDNNTWSKKSDFGGDARTDAVGFGIGSKGYLGTGYGLGYYKDIWEYNPAVNTWTQKADFGGTGRYLAIGFSIGSKGYLGTGYSNTEGMTKDFWEYDPDTNSWIKKADFGGTARYKAVGFSISNKGYLGTGNNFGNYYKDFWEYVPECNGLTVYADTDGDSYGDISNSYFASDCIVPAGYVIESSDCDDANAVLNPEATEIANGIDDNCNGLIDECNTPKGLLSKNITTSSVKLVWDAVVGANSYKLRYKLSGTGTWTLLGPAGHKKTVENLIANTKYVWQIRSVCSSDPKITSDWSAKQFFTTAPLRLATNIETTLVEVFPNPVSNSATISFSLPQTNHATIELYDVAGKKLQIILDQNLAAGNHDVIFHRGQLSSGLYLLQVKMGEKMEVRKVVVE